MSNKSPMYRHEALLARRVKWLGDIVLIRPLSFTLFTSLAAVSAIVVLVFLFCASYTKRSTVAGQIIPQNGLLKVYAPQGGIVLEKHVAEGQRVERGQVLYVLSSERHSTAQSNTQQMISQTVDTRQQSLRDEQHSVRLLQQGELAAFSKKIAGLQAELDKLEHLLDGQKNRMQLAEESRTRYQGLLDKDYISKELLQQKQAELLEHNSRLQSYEREKIALARDIALQESEFNSLKLKHQNQLAQYQRNIALTQQELLESEARRRLVITAPESGMATATSAEVGQAVAPTNPLLNLLTPNNPLQAHLYAPSRAIGFIAPGKTVLLRYQAFPYQKFGHGRGVVTSVSKTALPGNELAAMGGGQGENEPMYKITVSLEAQNVMAYGRQQALQAGMLLEADIMHDTRRIYEWVLEPLYSISGKL